MKTAIATYHILKGDATVLAAATGGIYPQLAKEGTSTPYITIQDDGMDVSHTKTGGSTIDFGNVVVQINSTDQSEIATLADNVRAAMDGYSGAVSTGSETINITRCWQVGQSAFSEEETNRDMYIIEMEFRLRERRTADYEN